MDFDEFKEWTAKEINNYLPDEYRNSDITITEINKLGNRYTGLVVRRSGDAIAPAINLDLFFEKYQNGSEPQRLLNEMRDIVVNADDKYDYGFISNYEKVKDRLFIRLSNAERNKDILQKVPHVQIDDLAITYHVVFKHLQDGLASAIITNDLMKEFNISAEQLHKDSIENGSKLFPERVESLQNIIFSEDGRGVIGEPPYVITNTSALNGAAVMFYPDVLQNMADSVGSDLFVIPSSIHEVICFPDDGTNDKDHLQQTLRHVNCVMVSEDEQLSDNIYHYDRSAHIFESYDSFEERFARDLEQISSEQFLIAAEDPGLTHSGRRFH